MITTTATPTETCTCCGERHEHLDRTYRRCARCYAGCPAQGAHRDINTRAGVADLLETIERLEETRNPHLATIAHELAAAVRVGRVTRYETLRQRLPAYDGWWDTHRVHIAR